MLHGLVHREDECLNSGASPQAQDLLHAIVKRMTREGFNCKPSS